MKEERKKNTQKINYKRKQTSEHERQTNINYERRKGRKKKKTLRKLITQINIILRDALRRKRGYRRQKWSRGKKMDD